MIHVVFEQANVAALEKAMELDDSLVGSIIEIKDDFAVGPIHNIFETEGYQLRRDWWQTLLENSPYVEQLSIVDDKLTVYNLLQQLDELPEEKVWIWMGQNVHDVCGYYWLMTQMNDYQGRIEVLYLNNLPFINEKGNIFYPTSLFEILPKEFLKAKKLARPITLSEFEVDPDEWKKLCIENSPIRFLEGGKKISGKEVDFYDKDIVTNVTMVPQKLPKILGNILQKMKIKTGDVFLVWRMKEMSSIGKLELTGNWAKGWKEILVKLPGGSAILHEVLDMEA